MAREPIPADEIELEFLRATGPGGQNVNKVESAVRLRFDVGRSRVLPEAVKARLLKLAGTRATADGVVLLLGRRFRTREKNREDVLARLERLVDKAVQAPRRRRPTKPTAAAERRRLAAKNLRAEIKRRRSKSATDDD